ncbi:uncharacterized protein LOC111397946 [Olea europaea var. sylvestris]|uniref:uncharacterized protein LOC111397946 n=1 Tax=Olea europaea var. sylvestris TaxID=158386 RepID=UPI000C1CEF80|nr:uncharacterized protein LOC111397946 [Olea europaea var. sylvestris]
MNIRTIRIASRSEVDKILDLVNDVIRNVEWIGHVVYFKKEWMYGVQSHNLVISRTRTTHQTFGILQIEPFGSIGEVGNLIGECVGVHDNGATEMLNLQALKTSSFPSTQPTPESLFGKNVATGPPLPQHLPVHPYSQPSIPLGPFANMIGYPFLPQSFTYMPSAFQQQFAGNNTYHQSSAAILPQYKNSVSVSSLPQSAAVASGYDGFGSTTTIPGNFLMNMPTAPSGTNLSYDDVLSSRYKDSNHLISLQQNENSAMWLHGTNPKTVSAVLASTYYNYQGQNQQSGGFRQGQQPSQGYRVLGYPNF